MTLYYHPQRIIQSSSVILSSDVSTTSTSYVDLTGMTITIQTDSNLLQCWFSAGPNKTGATGKVQFQLVLDGVAKRGTQTRVDNFEYNNSVGLLYNERVSVGEHTVKIQWLASSGTARLRPTSVTWETASLVVEELGV